MNTKTDKEKLISLAKLIVKVLETKALAGVKNKTWIGFENGNGTDVGHHIDSLIKNAKKIILKNK